VSDAPILQVRDLQAAFRSGGRTVRAVRGVDLDLHAGERLGLVGESGCGKSALAMAISGLLEPPGSVDRGSIVLGGRDLAALPERQRRRTRGRDIAVVFQDALSGLDPVKPIGRQITEGMRVHDPNLGRAAARRRAVELLQEVGIAHAERRVDEYPHQFSGGMRQRVMIAIAIANEPSVLIADEPTTALDVTTQAQILRLLSRMTEQRGCAVIFITHDLGIVAGFCDSVCVMYAGRIVERSATASLFAHPVHPYTEALLQAVPRRDGSGTRRLREIGGAPPDLSGPIQGCSFRPRCPLGRDRDDCLRLSPPLVPVELDGARIEAECHLAEARAAAAREAVGS
jgi:oligopeptide/dipeptide ABC transporter ATP-binding protein